MLRDQACYLAANAHSIPKGKGTTARPDWALEPYQPNSFKYRQAPGSPKRIRTQKESTGLTKLPDSGPGAF
jgi:hypothetical protein